MIGHVYKIRHVASDVCYIGSTLHTLRKRWMRHCRAFKTWVRTGRGAVFSIYAYFKKFGAAAFRIELLATYRVADRKQLLAYEQLWMNRTANININHAFNPLTKRYGPTYRAAYRAHHLDKLKQYHHDYYVTHQAYYKAYRDRYNAAHRDANNARERIRYAQKKLEALRA
jgi:hypothetical protein